MPSSRRRQRELTGQTNKFYQEKAAGNLDQSVHHETNEYSHPPAQDFVQENRLVVASPAKAGSQRARTRSGPLYLACCCPSVSSDLLSVSSRMRQTPTWKKKFKVGDELERNKRIELHAKVTSLSGKLRKAFLASDESGDSKYGMMIRKREAGRQGGREAGGMRRKGGSELRLPCRLQPDEVREMLRKWGKDLDADEISLLEDFLWKADRNDDGVLEYDEFVNRLSEFEQSLRFDRANQVSHDALTALLHSSAWREIEKNRREIISEMAKSCSSGIRSMTKAEVWEALGRVKGMRFADDMKEWFITAANTWNEDRFNGAALFDHSSQAGAFDVANFNFMRETVKDLRPTQMSAEELAEYKAKALARMEKMRPNIEKLISKLTLQVGNSLHRAFRALDENKTGVLNAEKIYNGFKRHGVKISEEEAAEIVRACDINGDGHIELIDFQNLFNDEVKGGGGRAYEEVMVMEVGKIDGARKKGSRGTSRLIFTSLHLQATVDMDRNRSLVVRSAAIPSLVLQHMRENDGRTGKPRSKWERGWLTLMQREDGSLSFIRATGKKTPHLSLTPPSLLKFSPHPSHFHSSFSPHLLLTS
eukprot:688713-Hanusia_phi.AAC.7